MEAPLYAVMKECRNFFDDPRKYPNLSRESGTFEIKDGTVKVKKNYSVGQYVRISGSTMNNGVYRVESVEDGALSFVQSGGYEPWVRPDGAHNAYKAGARVIYNGLRYISRIDANVYVPGEDPRWWEYVPGIELESSLQDEVFKGEISGLAIEGDFIALVKRIADWEQRMSRNPSYGVVVHESNQAGSITYATGADGGVAKWQDVFSADLRKYKKMWERGKF